MTPEKIENLFNHVIGISVFKNDLFSVRSFGASPHWHSEFRLDFNFPAIFDHRHWESIYGIQPKMDGTICFFNISDGDSTVRTDDFDEISQYVVKNIDSDIVKVLDQFVNDNDSIFDGWADQFKKDVK